MDSSDKKELFPFEVFPEPSRKAPNSTPDKNERSFAYQEKAPNKEHEELLYHLYQLYIQELQKKLRHETVRLDYKLNLV